MAEPLADPSALTAAPLPRRFLPLTRKHFFAGVPMLALLFAGGATWFHNPTGDQRVITPDFLDLEARLERRLYAPTSMPQQYGLRPESGPTKGAHRIMQAYASVDAQFGLIMAQEPRTPARDAYHQRLFKSNPERKVDLDGKRGYFITGETGERRLFWEEKDASLILSSGNMPDEALVTIALSVRPGPDR